ncbi:glycosyltransferase family 2 protein [Lentilactobacillus sp. Marseille-Q4993]|uniref:glycosyltransferase family 2 protein n=1 Tax=Lentilactobacillus sp. Marseille-Q4993 TaxID=3039492 RepID=UPI0024BC41F9|nr:glycosyltransferase family 2 protein [Lentilactobacillus sp. Marseille-Q4993]
MFFIKLVSTILTCYIFLYMVYYNLISLKTYFGKSETVRRRTPTRKFLVVIPAHNEEAVIDIPVKDLLAQKYPKELYDVYVIADRCSDRTAQIAATEGAKVITSEMYPDFIRWGIGKSSTLDFGINNIENVRDYDYLVVIDSDNRVSPNFLQRFNDYAIELNNPEAMQGALKSKKGQGIINDGLNLSFMRAHHFQQLPESKSGAASLLGTGFATRMDVVLMNDGFRFKTLVEDEYEELLILSHGGDIKYVADAYVENENYSELKQATRGLTRWSRGSFECFLRFFGLALLNILTAPTIKNFHVFCRISTLSKALQINVLIIMNLITFITNHVIKLEMAFTWFTEQQLMVILILNCLMALNLIVIESVYILKRDNGMLKTGLLIFRAYVFQIYYQIINVWAVLTFFKKKWIVTNHGHTNEVKTKEAVAEKIHKLPAVNIK